VSKEIAEQEYEVGLAMNAKFPVNVPHMPPHGVIRQTG
jgi:hypothetical protein